MKLRASTVALVAVQAVMVLTLAACGGSREDAATADADTKEAQGARRLRTIDTTAPSVAISTVGTVDANGATSLAGTASDNLSLYRVTWSVDTGSSGTATLSGTGTSATWTASGVALRVGSNVVTVTARDAAGNTSSVSQTVTRADPATTGSTSTGTGSTTTTSSSTWTTVATEGQTFSLPSAQLVRYGADPNWIQKTVSGTVACTNAYFGSDPAYMVVKSCQVSSTTTTTTPTTTTASDGSTTPTTTTTTPTPAAPTVSLASSASSVASGSAATLTWSSANATACSASGAWSGAEPTSGSASTGALNATSTFTLTCTGDGGTATQSLTVTVTSSSGSSSTGMTALDFPSNGSTSADVRFRFTGSNLIPMYPATYIWRVKPRWQAGYYTTFFWGPDGAFTGKDFYGAHPYPDGGGSSTTTHKWELSIWGSDYVNDANGNSTQLGYDVWRTQALRVWDNGSAKVHEFYWDLPDTTKVIRVSVDRSYGASPPSNAALTFGDAPWNLGGERLSGLLRGIQLYASALSVADILAEVSNPLSTSAGSAGIWYLNLNPTPSDISDKSGKGHHPAWVSSSKAGLWSSP